VAAVPTALSPTPLIIIIKKKIQFLCGAMDLNTDLRKTLNGGNSYIMEH
jgi:uncharacterized protein YunC (DUF1805 family)